MSKKIKFKLSEKQRQNRINRFISKYGYDPRSSYRPKKTGIRGRPVKTMPFHKSLVKSANERFRKLESVYNLTDMSNEYNLAKKYASEQSKTKGKIYNQKLLKEKGIVRLVGEKEYNKLSPKDKKYYNEVLQNILNSATSLPGGIEEKRQKSYNTFMQNYGDKYPDLSRSQYEQLFRTYRDLVNADKKAQFDYNTLVQTLEFVDIGEALRQDQLEKAMTYIAKSQMHKIPKRYRLRT